MSNDIALIQLPSPAPINDYISPGVQFKTFVLFCIYIYHARIFLANIAFILFSVSSNTRRGCASGRHGEYSISNIECPQQLQDVLIRIALKRNSRVMMIYLRRSFILDFRCAQQAGVRLLMPQEAFRQTYKRLLARWSPQSTYVHIR